MATVFKVEGELAVKDGTGTMMEFYEEDFVLDDITKEEARALIKKGLITERLQRKVEGFRRVRTCQVVDMKPSKEKAEDSELTVALLKAIELGCVPSNIDSYKRQDYKLKALQRAIETHNNRKPVKSSTQNLGIVND